MPMICVVNGCSNRSNREKDKRFYRVPKVVVHKGVQCKKLTEQRRKKWIFNLRLRSGGAESANARVCSDHFIRGCPSALRDVGSVDWAPTVNLGYQTSKPQSEASLQREQTMKLKQESQRRLECAFVMLDLLQTADSFKTEQPADNPQSEGIDGTGTLNNQVPQSNVQQLLVCKEEPHEQEWSPNLEQPPHIKEEQEGDQVQGPEEGDIIMFTFNPDFMMSKEDDEEPQGSQLHQIQVEQIQIGADEQNSGESDPSRDPETGRLLLSVTEVKTEDSDDETDDSEDWENSDLSYSGSFQDERPETPKIVHTCTQCGKTFKKKSNLTTHIRSHTGERPFSCLECGKSFNRKTHLTVHRRIHTGERPFVCSDCGKDFNTVGHLIQHKRIHTGEKPYICSECGKGFKSKGHLNAHKRTHTGEKPYGCSECDKRYNHKSYLTIHMRTHTGEKPFSCPECGKRFNQSAALNRHRLLHRGRTF